MTTAILPLSWAEVLDRVAQTLRDAEAETLRAEQALIETPDCRLRLGTDAKPQAADPLEDCLARAERVAADAETAVRIAEEALTAWLAQLETARQNLATTTAAAI